jgi:transposase InsO family protein
VVLKDDFSGFVELIPATAADHFMVADALVQWYSRIGMPLIHVSDHRSHFKDKVIKELNGILQINHHMTTVYSPWANGTVETVNNDIQKLLRSLLSEWQMESSEGATCTSFNSVCFESFAFFVSSKLCPSQDHDRPGRVQPAISSIRS